MTRSGVPTAAAFPVRLAAPPPALRVLQAGLLLCTLAFIPHRPPTADDFMFPRELLLHLVAVSAALLCLWRMRTARVGSEDLLGAAFLVLGALSYAAAATNPWLAARAFGLTSSGLVIFWCARALARDGWGDALTRAAALAAALLAATALLEVYSGVELSMPNRAPGGVLGHRNSAAHLLVLVLPVLLMHALRARRRSSAALLCAALAMAAATLVLSRSRGAWLAAIVLAALAAAVPFLAGGSARLPAGRRVGAVVLALLVGGTAAVHLPNRLSWRTGSHAETLSRLVDHSSGSGRGRVVQYARTLGMIGDHALLGVGPGNWTVEYPRYASDADPSYQPRALVPTSRLPQGDWIGLAAERGLPALALLALMGAVLAARSARILRGGGDPAERGRACCALGVMAALAVLGTFDPILLQPLHTFYIALVLGALVPPGRTRELPVPAPALRPALPAVLLLASAAPLGVSVRQFRAAALLAGASDPGTLARASRIHPGEYRLHALLAARYVAERRCDLALPHIRAAGALFPTATAPRAMGARCSPPVVR